MMIPFADFLLLLLAAATLLYACIAIFTTYIGYKLSFLVGLIETFFWVFLTGVIIVKVLA